MFRRWIVQRGAGRELGLLRLCGSVESVGFGLRRLRWIGDEEVDVPLYPSTCFYGPRAGAVTRWLEKESDKCLGLRVIFLLY